MSQGDIQTSHKGDGKCLLCTIEGPLLHPWQERWKLRRCIIFTETGKDESLATYRGDKSVEKHVFLYIVELHIAQHLKSW